MPSITDKFGKASISSDVAIATTVKTTRSAGVNVLEAVDLSKYATDTPVFVVTYKKTTDPLTGAVSISQLRSWKALVNTGANTLTNLTIQPGYADDIGNAIGDFIECIPTSAWENSLIDGILTSLNADGTLKTSAVQSALGIVNNPSAGWTILAQSLTWVSHTASGGYVGNFNGDMTNILSPGMKLLVPRTSAVPTQCMSFTAASSQYATKTSPTGINITNTLTWESWIYIPTSGYVSPGMIISRTDTTAANGWYSQINAQGQLTLAYGTGGSMSAFSSAASLPTGKWIHVAAAITSVSGKTVQMWVDGETVTTYSTATAGSTLTNTGNFTLGRWDNGTQYTNVLMGETRLWNTARTTAEIQANKDIPLTGGESGLIGLWQGNGNFNDKTANGNNLTGFGGAVATQLMSSLSPLLGRPAYFNAIEYFFVTKVGAYSAGVTPVNMVGGKAGRLPNQSMGTIQYSNVKTPFGFPSDKSNWTWEKCFYSQANITCGAAPAWTAMAHTNWGLPLGIYDIDWSGYMTGNVTTGSVGQTFAMQLSPTGVAPTSGGLLDKTQCYAWAAGATAWGSYLVSCMKAQQKGVVLYNDTTFQLWGIHTSAPGGSIAIYMERSPMFFNAVLSYAL